MSNAPFLPFTKPSFGPDEIAEVVACLESGWVATGPRVQKFEEMLRDYTGAPHALTVTSATAGLFLALHALHLEPGDEVITTPMTFAATLNTIIQAGGKPVLVDVDPGTYNMDIGQVEAAITPRTRALMPVHFAGVPVDLDPLYALAEKHGLRVIEDAAHAIGTEYKGRPIGTFGDIQVYSFHPNKNMTTGEGGAVITRDDQLAQHLQIWRFHGMDRATWNRFSKTGSQHYDVVAPGYKFNMMDLQAALGICQLPRLSSFVERRGYFARRYMDQLQDWAEFDLPRPPSYDHLSSWHLFAPRLVEASAGMDRDTFMARMKEHNIGTGLHYPAVHLYSYYRDTFGWREGDFPHAEDIGRRIVSLPLFPDMTEADQDRVISAMRHIFDAAQK